MWKSNGTNFLQWCAVAVVLMYMIISMASFNVGILGMREIHTLDETNSNRNINGKIYEMILLNLLFENKNPQKRSISHPYYTYALA